jgi:hypothetical protein
MMVSIKRIQDGPAPSIFDGETAVEYYAGIDVSLESLSVCVMDGTGRVVREGKVASEPECLIAWLRQSGVDFARVGLEAGPFAPPIFTHQGRSGSDASIK